MRKILAALCVATLSPLAFAQACPEKNVLYWQAFPPGGESDISARHQQVVLKKKCPNIDTIIQYKPGAGGGLMWSQMNTLPPDGLNIVGVNLPHIVFQPLEGQVQYKTEDIVPVYWFHYTPDTLVVRVESPIKTFQDFVKAAKAEPGKLSIAGSALYSANHVAHARLNREFGIKTEYVPFKGTGDLVASVLGGHVAATMSYTTLAIQQKGRMRMLAVATRERVPQFPDVPTFRELGVDWMDGAGGGTKGGVGHDGSAQQGSRVAQEDGRRRFRGDRRPLRQGPGVHEGAHRRLHEFGEDARAGQVTLRRRPVAFDAACRHTGAARG